MFIISRTASLQQLCFSFLLLIKLFKSCTPARWNVCLVVQLSDLSGVRESRYKVRPVVWRWRDEGFRGEEQGEIRPAVCAAVSFRYQVCTVVGHEQNIHQRVILYFSLSKKAEPGGICSWPGWLTIAIQCYDTVSWIIRSVKSSTKCVERDVNPTIPSLYNL